GRLGRWSRFLLGPGGDEAAGEVKVLVHAVAPRAELLLGFDGREDGHFIAVYEPRPVAVVVVPSSGDFVARGPVDRPVACVAVVEDDCPVLTLVLVEGEGVHLRYGGHVVAHVDRGHASSQGVSARRATKPPNRRVYASASSREPSMPSWPMCAIHGSPLSEPMAVPSSSASMGARTVHTSRAA